MKDIFQKMSVGGNIWLPLVNLLILYILILCNIGCLYNNLREFDPPTGPKKAYKNTTN